MKLLLAAASIALLPTLASAQTPPTPAPAPASAAAVDPARLAMARRVAAKLLPEGTYREMMGSTFSDMMEATMGSTGEFPLAELMTLGGLDPDKLAELGDARLGEIMEIYDPNWEARTKAMVDAMAPLMADVMDKIEPAVREAMAQSYAREFSLPELTEMDRFFSTPVGAHYAAKSIALFMSPEMMKVMADLTPELMKQMPAIMEAVMAAGKDLPEPRKLAEMTPAERKRLAELLGVDEKDLTDPGAEPEALELEETH
ncbi:DUF2059 domain-containing protein [Sphingomonas sp. AOB5]|uniref:DUF2059 domain-containing protein n=1 Tax=Sphingomonas sp. AOB5 TaxID=3034017 RepID=UPI0023F871A9|nr:DUF2059 domain-containing protein [Sphingomonas sp. AOB5]MDF7775336.1 DUF2059 domain-containing protein [Sphingomonas sp. AOB5]